MIHNQKSDDCFVVQIELTQVRLQRASKLIGQLGGERVRWTHMEKLMASSYINIVGDVLIASAIVAYLGPFTLEFRNVRLNYMREDYCFFGISRY